MDDETRILKLERLDILRSVLVARERLPEVVQLIEEGATDDEVRLGLQTLLGCSEAGAGAILNTQLRRFRRKPVDALALEIADLERQLD
jgi:DNA gyrase/topoisomerase IV subunit A